MPDDGVIYEGRKASGRTRHLRVIPKSESFEPRAVTPFESFPGTKGMLRRDSREPEVAHPSGSRNRTNMYGAAIINTDTARANAIRSAGKQAFLSVVKETVELVALEAASKAVHEETERMEELRHSEMCSNGTSRTYRPSKPNGSLTNNNIASITRWPINPHMQQTVRSSDVSCQDNDSSARHSLGRNNSSNSSRNGHAPSSERRHRRSRSASREEEEGGSLSFRSTVHPMEDEERETLLSLLTGAYSQVNELTDELQIALQKLHETEQNLKASSMASESQSQQSSEALREEDSVNAADVAAPTVAAPDGNTRSVGGMFFKGFFPVDEGARSTPATVRQLQVEVQRLRQRVMQSSSKEEKYRAELARYQRLIAVMESQMGGAGVQGPAPGTPLNGNKRLNGSSTAGSPDPKPLVDRVAELEEKLVNCSMENATAKQDHLASKLRASQLEKNVERVRHELAKSRAMNDLLQNEIDRLQGTMDPEDEADGKGWRRWLGGVQEPLSPDPNPIKVQGIEDSDSPVVVVRDLDNNQLVYAPGRSEFF